MVSPSYNTSVYFDDNGDELVVDQGGVLTVKAGGAIVVQAGAAVTGIAGGGGVGTLGVVINGSPIAPGIVGDLIVPYSGTITSVEILADQAGSIVVDIWKGSYANYPPTSAGSIAANAKPTLSAAIKSQDTTLTGWNRTLAAGDILRFNVNSSSTVQRATLVLNVNKL